MTVHSEGQPVSPAGGAIAHTASGSNPAPQTRATTIKVLGVLLAVMTGVAAALAAYIVGAHLTKSAADPIVWAAATFVATTGLVILLEEKTGLLG